MPSPKENPFLGLKPYGEKDQLYGRDRDLFLMTDRIFCARTTLLFAGSGVGKTSFINAKIIPELNSQYASIIYHKEWAIGQPLENLLSSIAKHLPTADASPAVAVAAAVAAGSQDAPPVKPPLFDPGNKLGCYLKQFISEEPGSDDANRCLLILDQFEEVFQHHRGKAHFDLFITQLAEVINYKHCNVRVLFSMREEFLGELSVFDNKIPDLFSNYYRLKNPNKQGATKIINRTCSLVDMPVDDKKLTRLVSDLTRIETVETTSTHDQNGDEGSQDLDIVAPPYLQIACRRLWERQFNSANALKSRAETGEGPEKKFLSDYKDDDARAMLKSFCEEILNAFNNRDRALLAEAFNYLVTKKGAKMAYPLSSLADHMGVKESWLGDVLHRLSEDDSRILRESKGPDRALWYELYHDMYGKIIDEWRRAYRLQQQAESRRRLIAAAGVIVVIGLLTIWIWNWIDRRQEKEATLLKGNLSDQVDFQQSKDAFDYLQNTLFSGNTGRVLWGDAWTRRAVSAETSEDAQLAFLSYLKAAEVYPSDRQDSNLLSEINSYLNSDEYGALRKSYRLEVGVTTSPAFQPFLTADGKLLLTFGRDGEVFFWNTNSYKKAHSTRLAIDSPAQSNVSFGPPRNSQHAVAPNPGLASETQIQAATENLIGGLDKDKFCIWDANSGQKLWQLDYQSGPSLQSRKPAPTALTYNYYGSPVQQLVQQPSLFFSSTGRFFATSNGSDSFLLYQWSNDNKGEPLLADLMRSVTKLQFSPDGHNVALIFKDGTAQLRNLDTNDSRSLAIDGKSVRGIIFSSDGSRFLADMGEMRPGQIWNSASGSKILETSGPMGEQFFCPDNRTIASVVAIDQQNATTVGIRFWNSETNSVRIRAIRLDERIDYFINPDGESLLTIGPSGNAQLWDLTPPDASANNLITDSAQISASEISEDGQVIVTVNDNQKLSAWNANDLTRRGAEVSLSTSMSNVNDLPFSQMPGTHGVNQLVVSNSGKYVCLKIGFKDFSVRKLGDKNEIIHGTFADVSARAAAFSPNEKTFAVADQKGSITLWKNLDTTPTQTVIRLDDPSVPVLESTGKPISKFVFSPDGTYLAAIVGYTNSSYAYVLELAKVSDPVTHGKMNLPTEGFTQTIALGNDGIMIGTIANDNKVVLVWNLTKGQAHKLRHDSNVTAVALNRDGSRALTSTSNGTLQLWDTANEKQLANGPCGTRIQSLTIMDDQTAVAVSDKWFHIHSINGKSLEYLNGREIASFESLRILDRSGKNFRSLFPHIQDSLRVERFDLSSPSPSNLKDPARLFGEWRDKLALNFDQNGLIIPLRPQ